MSLETQLVAAKAALEDAGLTSVYLRGETPDSLPSGAITIIDVIPGAPTPQFTDAEVYENLSIQVSVYDPAGVRSALTNGRLAELGMLAFGSQRSAGTQVGPSVDDPNYYAVILTFSQVASFDVITE